MSISTISPLQGEIFFTQNHKDNSLIIYIYICVCNYIQQTMQYNRKQTHKQI